MGYLVCEKCKGYYKLQKGENPKDFNDECKCGGHLKYSMKPTITTEIDKKEAKTKLKELTGGFLLSSEFLKVLEDHDITSRAGYDIQEFLKDEIKEGKLKSEDLEPRLNYILEHPNVPQDVKDQETLKKLKPKMERYKQDIRRGVHCKILKPVVGAESFGGLAKGAATLAFGITGWALTSGVSTKAETIEVDATIKVVPKGVVILSDQEETLRMPFEQIIRANNKGRTVIIKVVGDKKVTVKDCDHYNEVAGLILESACGKEDEGWV